MSAWPTVRLGEIAESIDYGVTASASGEQSGPKFLRISDIQNGEVNWSTVPWCECDARTAASARLRPGDIVFARTGATTGKSYLIRECPEYSVFASYLIRVRPGQEIHANYLAHFFGTTRYWSQISQSARGAAQPGVNATVLKTLEVPLAPLPEQRRIAEVLDRAEVLRAKRREALALLDELVQACFHELFEESGSKRSEWLLSTVGEISDVQGGLQVSSARKDLPREVAYLRVANVYRGYLDLSEIKYLRVTEAEASRTALMKDDVLVVEGHGNPQEIGRCALWDGSIQACLHQNHLIRVRFDKGVVLPLFGCMYLNSAVGRRYLLRSGKTTSGLSTINVSEVRATPITLPPLSLQREFARRIAAVERLKGAQRASLAELDALFASLQHRAFRGEL